jgi:uncharacterized protein YdiU (UPF0061 family)
VTHENDLKDLFTNVSYTDLNDEMLRKLESFIKEYHERRSKNTITKEELLTLMQKTNPKFILRNYLLYQCIEEINDGKTELLNKLTQALENPYQEIYPEFSVKRPPNYDDISGCSTLSCSS